MSQAIAEQIISKEKVPSVFREYRFVLLFATTVISSFSVSFFMLATNWYVVNYLGLQAMLGLVLFASSVPRLIFMLIGGVIADRISKPWIMFISDFTKGMLLLGVIGLLLFDILSIWMLIGLALVFGVLDAFFYPASNSLLPLTVKKEQLTRANSVLNMTNQGSHILGPLLAGVLLAAGGYVLIFGVTAVALIVAGAIDIVLKRRMPEEGKRDVVREKTSIFQSIKEGFTYVKKSSFLLALMSSAIFLNLFFTGPLMIGLPVYATSILEGTAVTYSFLNGGIAGGMVVGTLIIGVMNIQRKRGLISLFGILTLAVSFLFLSLSSSFIVSLLIIVLIGMSSSVANVPLVAVIQKYTEQEYLGRVMSLISFSAMGLVPVSYLATSLVLGLNVPINVIMFFSASCLTIVSIIIMIKAKALRTVD